MATLVIELTRSPALKNNPQSHHNLTACHSQGPSQPLRPELATNISTENLDFSEADNLGSGRRPGQKDKFILESIEESDPPVGRMFSYYPS